MPYQITQLQRTTPTADKDKNRGWGWHLPTETTKISGYDFTGSHHGIDIGTVENTPLYAVTTGVVSYAGYNNQGYGNLLILKTSATNHNALVYYGHMNSFAVTPGTSVQAGQLIGYSGGKPGNPGAGSSSGPHLHFEIRLASGGWENPHDAYPGVYPGGTVAPPGKPPGDGNTPPSGEPGSPEAQEDFWVIHLPSVSIPVVGTVTLGDIRIAKPVIPWGDIALGAVGIGFVFVGVIGIAKETGITEKVQETGKTIATMIVTKGAASAGTAAAAAGGVK